MTDFQIRFTSILRFKITSGRHIYWNNFFGDESVARDTSRLKKMCQGNVVLGHDNTSILGWELETKGKTEENKMLFWPSVDHLGLLWFKKKKHFDGQTCPFGFIRCLLLIRPVLGSFHYNSYTWTWLINRLVRQEAEKILNRAIPSKKTNKKPPKNRAQNSAQSSSESLKIQC